ncbi:hypothetical protein ES703_65713 [subsurface metagenome]
MCRDRSDDTKYVRLLNEAPGSYVGKGRSEGEKGLPPFMPENIYMEITVKQAIFLIMAQTVTNPLPGRQFHTTRSIQKQLETGFRVKVTLKHVQRIVRGFFVEGIICEIEQPLKPYVPIPSAKAICYQLKHPEKMFTVKKWKREKGV